MRTLKQSSTAQKLTFLMVSSTDHITPVTGITPTVTLSKAGGSFASPAGAVSEVGNGWYVVAGNATDTNTLGSLILHATGTGADPTDREYEIVAFDPQSTALGLVLVKGTNLTGFNDIAATDVWAVGTRTLTSGTNIALAKGTGVTGFNDIAATDVWGATTRTLSAGTNIVLVKGTGLTGLNDIAATAIVSAGAITTSAGAISNVTNVSNVSTLTGHTPQTGDAYARIGSAGSGLTNLGDTRLANLNATIDSRLAAVSYEAPQTPPTPAQIRVEMDANSIYLPNANVAFSSISSDVTAIKAKTTNLPASPAAVGSAMTLAADSINSSSVATSAVTEIQAGLMLAASYSAPPAAATTAAAVRTELAVELARLDAAVSTRMASFTYIAPDNATLTKLAGMLELDGSVYRYTTNALEQAPASSGGGSGSGGLSGPSGVTITFHDAGGAAVPNVDFSIPGQGVDRSNGSGVAAFGLPDGAYSVVARPTNGVIFATTSLVVSGTTALTITGTAVSIPAPSLPTRCTVYGTLRRTNGQPAVGIVVAFQLSTTAPARAGSEIIVARHVAAAPSDDTGFFSVELDRTDQITPTGTKWLVLAPSLHMDGQQLTLTAATKDLGTLIT